MIIHLLIFEQTNMLGKFFVFGILILQLEFISTLDNPNDDSVTLNFEDNVEGKFLSFSKLNIRLSRQSNIELTPSRTISSSQYERLTDFQIDHPYYTLKVHFKRGAVQDYVMTSIPMCLVLQAQFQYSLTLFINENGYIVGVQVTTGNSTCSLADIKEKEKKNEYNYKVAMRLQLNDVGPQPDIPQFLEKLKRQQEAKLNAQENDNRPFVLKYWKYLLPIVVIFVLQSAFTSDAGGQGGGTGGQ